MSGAVDGSRAGFETARLKLAHLRLDGEDAGQAAMRQLARISGQALGVERVGVWLFEDEGRRLRNLSQYLLSSDSHASGEVLDIADCPAYLAALRERRVLAVTEARAHPLTRELTDGYLDVHGISSRIDAAIIREGAVAGVVCHEHVGPARIWSQKDRDFVASTADMAALFLEEADRLAIELALRQRREDQLAQEKMAALGRLARAVAHDINNVFNTLSLTGMLLEAREAEDLRRFGTSIQRAVGLGARLVEQLSLFGEEAAEGAARVDLAFLIDRMRPVLMEFMRGARLEIAVLSDATTVFANASQLEQVVLNLCLNAVEAIAEPSSGLIRIELRDARPDEPLNPASIVLTVEDNGQGMDVETQAHVFEPYFTRKAGGHGIGLSAVYGIVKRCRGTISVRSTPGAGATFTVALPRAPSPASLR